MELDISGVVVIFKDHKWRKSEILNVNSKVIINTVCEVLRRNRGKFALLV